MKKTKTRLFRFEFDETDYEVGLRTMKNANIGVGKKVKGQQLIVNDQRVNRLVGLTGLGWVELLKFGSWFWVELSL